MKLRKILIIITFILFITGCKVVKKETNLEHEKQTYQKYVKELKQRNYSSDDIPFDIDVVYDRITEDEVRYQVIIDNPKYDLSSLQVIAIHNKQTDDIFPSLGIFEEKKSLYRGKKPEGLVLVGYIPYDGKLSNFKCKMKVLVKYSYKEQTHTVFFVKED